MLLLLFWLALKIFLLAFCYLSFWHVGNYCLIVNSHSVFFLGDVFSSFWFFGAIVVVYLDFFRVIWAIFELKKFLYICWIPFWWNSIFLLDKRFYGNFVAYITQVGRLKLKHLLWFLYSNLCSIVGSLILMHCDLILKGWMESARWFILVGCKRVSFKWPIKVLEALVLIIGLEVLVNYFVGWSLPLFCGVEIN